MFVTRCEDGNAILTAVARKYEIAFFGDESTSYCREPIY
jgi:hypothetical protein